MFKSKYETQEEQLLEQIIANEKKTKDIDYEQINAQQKLEEQKLEQSNKKEIYQSFYRSEEVNRQIQKEQRKYQYKHRKKWLILNAIGIGILSLVVLLLIIGICGVALNEKYNTGILRYYVNLQNRYFNVIWTGIGLLILHIIYYSIVSWKTYYYFQILEMYNKTKILWNILILNYILFTSVFMIATYILNIVWLSKIKNKKNTKRP